MNDSVVIFLVILAAGATVILAYAIFNPSQLSRIRGRAKERDVEDIREQGNKQASYMYDVRMNNKREIVQAHSIRMGNSIYTDTSTSKFSTHGAQSALMTPGTMHSPVVQSPPPTHDPHYYAQQQHPQQQQYAQPQPAKGGYFVEESQPPAPAKGGFHVEETEV